MLRFFKDADLFGFSMDWLRLVFSMDWKTLVFSGSGASGLSKDADRIWTFGYCVVADVKVRRNRMNQNILR